MSVRIGIALVVGLMIGSAPISAVAGGGGGGDDEKRDTVGEVRSAKWYLRSSNDPACTAAATVFNKYADTDLMIAGHTDDTGNDAINQPLSEQRAQSVKSFLSTQNVASSASITAGNSEAGSACARFPQSVPRFRIWA